MNVRARSLASDWMTEEMSRPTFACWMVLFDPVWYWSTVLSHPVSSWV